MSLSTLHPNVDQYDDRFDVDQDFWFVSTSSTPTGGGSAPQRTTVGAGA